MDPTVPSPALSALLADFAATYLPARKFAPLTRSAYLHAIGTFIARAETAGVLSPSNVGLAALDAFLAHLDGQGLAGTTRRKYVSALKLFFGFPPLARPSIMRAIRNPPHKRPNLSTCSAIIAFMREMPGPHVTIPSTVASYDRSRGAARFLMQVARMTTPFPWSTLWIVLNEQPSCLSTGSIVNPLS